MTEPSTEPVDLDAPIDPAEIPNDAPPRDDARDHEPNIDSEGDPA